MRHRASGCIVIALASCVLAGSACSRDAAQDASRPLQVGRHRLRLVPPRGWEHLDHGRQQLFRSGEAELSLEDYGPATPRGLAAALREAERLWLAGRRND